jgi:hypothetical protein
MLYGVCDTSESVSPCSARGGVGSPEWARIPWQKGGTVARRILMEEYHLTESADLRLLNSLCAI